MGACLAKAGLPTVPPDNIDNDEKGNVIRQIIDPIKHYSNRGFRNKYASGV